MSTLEEKKKKKKRQVGRWNRQMLFRMTKRNRATCLSVCVSVCLSVYLHMSVRLEILSRACVVILGKISDTFVLFFS